MNGEVSHEAYRIILCIKIDRAADEAQEKLVSGDQCVYLGFYWRFKSGRWKNGGGAGLKPFQYLAQQGIRLAYYEVLMIVPQVW